MIHSSLFQRLLAQFWSQRWPDSQTTPLETLKRRLYDTHQEHMEVLKKLDRLNDEMASLVRQINKASPNCPPPVMEDFLAP